MGSRISLVGLPAVRKALAAAREIGTGAELIRQIGHELHRALLHVQSVAQDKTPVDTGVLEASAETHAGVLRGNTIEASISYGGLASRYAEVQHEAENFVHPKKGQHHFLFGDPSSAWESELPATMDELDRAAEKIAERHIAGAAVS